MNIATKYLTLAKGIDRLQAQQIGEDQAATARLILRAAMVNARGFCSDARIRQQLISQASEIEA
jgi:hypothetical protein